MEVISARFDVREGDGPKAALTWFVDAKWRSPDGQREAFRTMMFEPFEGALMNFDIRLISRTRRSPVFRLDSTACSAPDGGRASRDFRRRRSAPSKRICSERPRGTRNVGRTLLLRVSFSAFVEGSRRTEHWAFSFWCCTSGFGGGPFGVATLLACSVGSGSFGGAPFGGLAEFVPLPACTSLAWGLYVRLPTGANPPARSSGA